VSPLLIGLISLVMLFTSFLSGVFGMAGGLILVGVLLAVMPLPEAMQLHAVTQLASNGWRAALWFRHIRWRPIGFFAAGAAVAVGLWSLTSFVPPAAVALLLLGVSPFLVRLLPASFRPDPARALHCVGYGLACMSLMILTGVAGPLLDSFFLGGGMERRAIVATKAACQVFGHAFKWVYFASVAAVGIDPVLGILAVACSMAGTTLARRVLEAMSDQQYRLWAGRLITVIALTYIARGGWLLVVGETAAAP
jgi:uncharacterized protein